MNVTAVVGEARSWYQLVQDIRSLVEDFQNADETRRQFSKCVRAPLRNRHVRVWHMRAPAMR